MYCGCLARFLTADNYCLIHIAPGEILEGFLHSPIHYTCITGSHTNPVPKTQVYAYMGLYRNLAVIFISTILLIIQKQLIQVKSFSMLCNQTISNIQSNNCFSRNLRLSQKHKALCLLYTSVQFKPQRFIINIVL